MFRKFIFHQSKKGNCYSKRSINKPLTTPEAITLNDSDTHQMTCTCNNYNCIIIAKAIYMHPIKRYIIGRITTNHRNHDINSFCQSRIYPSLPRIKSQSLAAYLPTQDQKKKEPTHTYLSPESSTCNYRMFNACAQTTARGRAAA